MLLIVWEIKTGAEAIDAGRKPETVRGPWLADSLVEVKPTGRTTGEVVWELRLPKDHGVYRAERLYPLPLLKKIAQ